MIRLLNQTLLPAGLMLLTAAPACLAAATPESLLSAKGVVQDGRVHVLKVQGNVYMLVGAGANMAVQVGDQGIVLVNAGDGSRTSEVVAALRDLSSEPPHYIIDTSFDPDMTGGNADLKKIGAPVVGGNLGASNQGAAIVAAENTLNHLSGQLGEPAVPEAAWPNVTFFEGQKEIYFNNEAIRVMLAPAAHTDGDTMVYFRGSDVLYTGEVFNTVTYPVIRLADGGTVNGVLDALNHALDIAIPKHEQEGGTYIIPGHGRLCDEHDLLEYRDMVTIIRDRVEAAIKKGMTLEQVKAAGFTAEYDPRWGAASGPWTTGMFVEAVYKSLAEASQ
ncbi:MAG TPA: MBL fold metallo-hydrolase [Gammaproteobacteria bacterium]|nr:MBL fold metallo-hydrolase [Gammaproteobacteria bacterium]